LILPVQRGCPFFEESEKIDLHCQCHETLYLCNANLLRAPSLAWSISEVENSAKVNEDKDRQQDLRKLFPPVDAVANR
jgi:hypothetical protein